MRLKYKKLPKHWQYVVSKRQIKAFIESLSADLRLVEYNGPGHKYGKLTVDIHYIGEIKTRFINNNPCFRLRFSALPEQLISKQVDEMASSILEDLKKYVFSIMNDPPAILDAQMRTYFYQSSKNSLVPSFTTKRIEPIHEWIDQKNPWW